MWAVFLFAFPFSVRFIVYEEASYRFGNFNPWVTGFVYLPEILLGLIVIFWLIDKYLSRKPKPRPLPPDNIPVSENLPKNTPKEPETVSRKYEIVLWILLLLFVINAGVMALLNGNWVLFIFFTVRVIEAVIIYEFVVRKILPETTVIRILLAAALLQFVWGWLQWKLNHSLSLSFFGESVIGPDIMGVAKTDLVGGIKQIRPYGSFLHPNILAGYLMAIMFISLPYLKKYRLAFWLVVLTGAIFFTRSLAASVVTLACFILIIIFSFVRSAQTQKHITLLVLLLFFLTNAWFFVNSSSLSSADSSLQERLDQNVMSHEMFLNNPSGVGVSNYTLEMEKYSAEKLQPWGFQPVHNTYFLILNEVGIQGLVLLLTAIVLIFYIYWKQSSIIPLLSLVLIAPFDHFLWDSFAGLILIALVFGFFTLHQKQDDSPPTS